MPSNKTEYYKKWYAEHKESHKEYMSEKIKCDCGRIYTRCHKPEHLRSRIHMKYLEINGNNKKKCLCGDEYIKGQLQSHLASKNHISWKENLLKLNNQKLQCECGKKYNKYYKYDHITSKFHVRWLEENKDNNKVFIYNVMRKIKSFNHKLKNIDKLPFNEEESMRLIYSKAKSKLIFLENWEYVNKIKVN